MPISSDSIALHCFLSLPWIGQKTAQILLEHFSDLESAWKQPETSFENLPLSEKTMISLRDRHRLVSFEQEQLRINELSITLLSKKDGLYPKLLKEIPDAPTLLYTKGSYDWSDKTPFITIVGTRRPTTYGKQVTAQFARDLARAGFVIVSGLALGTDGLAHEATLEAGGITLAVLGSGIDTPSIAPQSHVSLAEAITEKGALISEFPPGTEASAGTFPARNRIMAGLSKATLVIEAAEKSGSLITTRLALDYNRDVLAIPGSIYSPYSRGSNLLIRDGAKIVTCLEDILEEFPVAVSKQSPASTEENPRLVSLSPEKSSLYRLLSHEAIHIDTLVTQSGLKTEAVATILTILEMRGLAKNIGGMHYIRIA